MATGDFLLIAGLEWIEIQNPGALFSSLASVHDIAAYITNQEWNSVGQLLEDAGIIAPNTVISNAQIINTEPGELNYKMWYVL